MDWLGAAGHHARRDGPDGPQLRRLRPRLWHAV